MKKNIYIIASAAIILLLLTVLCVYILKTAGTSCPTAGNIVDIKKESAWVCKNGQWEKQGEPVTPKPLFTCTEDGQKYEWHEPTSLPPETTATEDLADFIKVESPQPNGVISNGFEVKGQARGSWYFEASFPVKLIDSKGQILAETNASALSDWMTEDFVPFTAKLTFAYPETKTGILVFNNDNPSGLAGNKKELLVPVTFGDGKKMVLKAYFGNSTLNPNAEDCSKVFAVGREVDYTVTTAQAALEQLLVGPTEAEKNEGYYTSINSGVAIQSLEIKDGTAKADFSKKIEENAGGSCRVSNIRSQIEQTLLQFPTVKAVIISVNGRTEDILQP